MINFLKLLEIYKEEYELNLKEGLIKTTNIGQTISILQKKYPNKFNFTYTKGKNAFSIQTFALDLKVFNDLLKISETLGWFPSWIETDNYIDKWNPKVLKDKEEIKIRFEAKYDIN